MTGSGDSEKLICQRCPFQIETKTMKAIYIDEKRQPVNLGRLGKIHYGDLCEFTAREVDHINGDPDTKARWHFLKDDKVPESITKKAESFRKARVKASQEALKAAGASDQEAEASAELKEGAREDQLQKNAQGADLKKIELEQMSKGDLLDYARRAKQGGAKIAVNQRMSKGNILKEILDWELEKHDGR